MDDAQRTVITNNYEVIGGRVLCYFFSLIMRGRCDLALDHFRYFMRENV